MDACLKLRKNTSSLSGHCVPETHDVVHVVDSERVSIGREIRSIGPGFYLGRVYWDKKPLIHFALEFQ